jgi:pyruvate/oxaloacetate carboxyltransferase
MVLDVFTPQECLQIVQAAEAIGFEKDEAAGGSATSKASVSFFRRYPWNSADM